jgi:hypothetical protein
MGTLYPYNAADICLVRELSVADKKSAGRSRNRHVNLCWYVGRIRQTLDTLRRELSGREGCGRIRERVRNWIYLEDTMADDKSLKLPRKVQLL